MVKKPRHTPIGQAAAWLDCSLQNFARLTRVSVIKNTPGLIFNTDDHPTGLPGFQQALVLDSREHVRLKAEGVDAAQLIA